MQAHIHGHDVMQMMMEEGKAYTKATLRTAILERFGEEARFHTCSADNMTADELIAFLESRGKFIAGGGGYQVYPDSICSH